MAISNEFVEEAPVSLKSHSKSRCSMCTSTAGNDSHSNSQSRTFSISVPVDPSVLAMVSATMSDEVDSDDGSQHQRKSQLCCLFCCDLIKAGIIMNSLHIVLELSHLLVSVLAIPSVLGLHIELYDFVYDDDMIDPNLQIKTLDPWAVIGYTKLGLGFVFALVGILGALRFSNNMVLCSAIFNCCYIFTSGIHQEWTGFFVPMPFAYTNFHLYLELKNGNLTRENYTSERHCCCHGSADDADCKGTV